MVFEAVVDGMVVSTGIDEVVVEGAKESVSGTLGKDSVVGTLDLDFLAEVVAGETDEVAGTLEALTPVVTAGSTVFLSAGEELRARPMISCALAE